MHSSIIHSSSCSSSSGSSCSTSTTVIKITVLLLETKVYLFVKAYRKAYKLKMEKQALEISVQVQRSLLYQCIYWFCILLTFLYCTYI